MDTLATLQHYRDNLQQFINEGTAEYITRDFTEARHNKTRGHNVYTVQYKMSADRLQKLNNELNIIDLHIKRISVNLQV